MDCREILVPQTFACRKSSDGSDIQCFGVASSLKQEGLTMTAHVA
jgi:hypothetical protein